MAKIDAPAVAALPAVPYEGAGYRQQAPEFDPLSGEGARRRGGRFNPPDSFPVLYLCSTRACAVAEFYRAGDRLAIGPEGLLPRDLFQYRVYLNRVVDLTLKANQEQLGISQADLVGEDLSITRAIGESAQALGMQAALSFSATRHDSVLAVFLQNIGSGVLDTTIAETWSSLADVGELS